jgi:D-serine deaminase-like pyridoxal phosphate-dependent protein
VHAHKKRWQAQISYDSKQRRLGYFDTRQEAALAYDRAARQCGEDKLLNYESIKAAEEAAVQAQAEYTLMHYMCAGPKQPKPRPASGFYGVSASRKRWKALVYYDSNDHNLGTFDTKQEAALAYDRAARQCGADKLLNYESIKAAEEAAVQAQAEIFAEALCAGPKQPKPRPASGFYGVYASTGKRWQALICYDSKKHSLGCFDTKQEAALAYDREARQCGVDKLLNYEGNKAAEESAQAQSEIRR